MSGQIRRNFRQISRPPNPVKKNMDKFHKPSTHRDRSKYDRKSEEQEIERMVDEGG